MIEVFYISMQEQGRTIAEERLSLIETLPLIQESLMPNITKTIGEMKAVKSMSFADCCIAGLSKSKKYSGPQNPDNSIRWLPVTERSR
jgi:hypothetical protein